MKKTIALLISMSMLAGGATLALAADKLPKCPVCHMSLTRKKDKMHTKAVHIKNKTYYCCAACNMKK
jgi:hypothetical protein